MSEEIQATGIDAEIEELDKIIEDLTGKEAGREIAPNTGANASRFFSLATKS